MSATEVQRLADARRSILPVTERYKHLVDSTVANLNNPAKQSKENAHALGSKLWRHAVDDISNGHLDDRSLYWTRLAIAEAALNCPQSTFNWFEYQSRNFYSAHSITEDSLVLTGFDPFSLHERIQQSNPSGVFVLNLHTRLIEGLKVHALLFPVRYQDFDDGCIEQTLTPFLLRPQVKGLITVSMGRDGFDLEHFPGRCRGSSHPDNSGQVARVATQLPGVGKDAPSFVPFALPTGDYLQQLALLENTRITDNCTVSTGARTLMEVSDIRQIQNEEPLAGSGGNFLSNEISYRSLLLRKQLKSSLPVGHIHVPRIEGYDLDQLKGCLATFEKLVTEIVKHF